MGRYRDDERDYSPFEDDYRGFDVREDDSTRGPLILALAVGVLLVFGAVVWNTYRQGVRDNGAGIPSVIADKEPYKRAPEDREGLAVPDTDKRFYDQMDDSERIVEPGTDLLTWRRCQRMRKRPCVSCQRIRWCRRLLPRRGRRRPPGKRPHSLPLPMMVFTSSSWQLSAHKTPLKPPGRK